MRLAQAIRQPALLRSEAVLLPALPTENVRAALSQVRSKDKNVRIDDSSFRPMETTASVNVRAGRHVQNMMATGSMAGRSVLRQVGSPYGNAVPAIKQNVRSFHSGAGFQSPPSNRAVQTPSPQTGTGAETTST